jgi:hydrogenase maturation protease
MMVVIGVGNEFRRDDGVGLVVAHALRTHALPGVEVIEASGEGAELLLVWEGAESVIVVDALASGAPPGTIYRLDATAGPLPASFFAASSHAFGLAEAVELARVLGNLPPRLVIYGIEGSDFRPGHGMTLPVSLAARKVVRQILGETDHARALAHGSPVTDY